MPCLRDDPFMAFWCVLSCLTRNPEVPHRWSQLLYCQNWRSGFLALGFFTVTDWLGDIGLLPVNSSGVETIAVSRIALYCCWSSHFPVVLYSFLMFSRHLCLYITLLLNDCSTPMVTICYFSHSDCNNPLIMTHCCSNDSISRIESITLVNAHDVIYYAARALFPSIWKQRYYFMGGGSLWPGLWVVLLSWYFIGSDPNKTWAFGAVTMWFFFWVFQTTGCRHQQRYLYSSCFLCVGRIQVQFEQYRQAYCVKQGL